MAQVAREGVTPASPQPLRPFHTGAQAGSPRGPLGSSSLPARDAYPGAEQSWVSPAPKWAEAPGPGLGAPCRPGSSTFRISGGKSIPNCIERAGTICEPGGPKAPALRRPVMTRRSEVQQGSGWMVEKHCITRRLDPVKGLRKVICKLNPLRAQEGNAEEKHSWENEMLLKSPWERKASWCILGTETRQDVCNSEMRGGKVGMDQTRS